MLLNKKIFGKMLRCKALMLLHLAFLVVVAGAIVTTLTSVRGDMHLRLHQNENRFLTKEQGVEHLPFTLQLNSFVVEYYPDSDMPMDYRCQLICNGEEETELLSVSMNNIGRVEGYRLYMMSYDEDGNGVTLGVAYDPWGTAVVYLGYALFVVGFIAAIFSRKTHVRNLLRQAFQSKTIALRRIHKCLAIITVIFLFIMSYALGCRWYEGGHAPVSNAYETMMLLAWFVQLIVVGVGRRFPLLYPSGLVLALLCVVLAGVVGGDSEVTPLMPVLRSPLLVSHVASVMIAYALFAIQMILGLYGLWLEHKKKTSELRRLTSLSRFMLYPSVGMLAVGIIIGSVWANVSWGAYWSWDPKELWALITMIVYAVPFHFSSLPAFRCDRTYSIYLVLAFLVVLFTYFGVNFFLSGMHSYA